MTKHEKLLEAARVALEALETLSREPGARESVIRAADGLDAAIDAIERAPAAEELFAWIGGDEFDNLRVNLKIGRTRAGLVPLAVMDHNREQLERPELIGQLQRAADAAATRLRLGRFVLAEDVLTLLPRPRG